MSDHNIREEVRAVLAERGIEQQELARRTGVTPETISRMLSGKTNAVMAGWRRVLDELGLELTTRPK